MFSERDPRRPGPVELLASAFVTLCFLAVAASLVVGVALIVAGR